MRAERGRRSHVGDDEVVVGGQPSHPALAVQTEQLLDGAEDGVLVVEQCGHDRVGADAQIGVDAAGVLAGAGAVALGLEGADDPVEGALDAVGEPGPALVCGRVDAGDHGVGLAVGARGPVGSGRAWRSAHHTCARRFSPANAPRLTGSQRTSWRAGLQWVHCSLVSASR